ncbi:helix-turn-helix domain-containing protein [Paraburkholderia sp. BL25I1N1]|uniref:winged helix-turn-helix transcriptional regulator n=1 Tax=Paraburkholderia sp. BL25I1N1 TaxID=1938804 RepID=UPI000D07FE33|nr:helix-turn-helix domain-containing protein [Paraburkholderia sp. BL25I1N1]PRY04473.1 HxlR family transcriptional regulator [Paraburkholderia sp. BL25I1N1]
MSWDAVCESVCPVARSLAIVGDRWTLLIMRELVLGVHRFDELQAQTGMSSHLLTTRLKRLEADGVIERRLYNERPPRHEYHQTQKGKELDPILMALRSWGQKWELGEDSQPAVKLVHKKSKKVIKHLWEAPNGGKNFTFDDVECVMSEDFAAEREERRTDFQSD